MQPEMDISKTLAQMMDLAPAGFAIALHVRFTTPAYLFQTYPAAWIEEYGKAGLVMSDPTVAWGFGQVGVVTWAELASQDPAGVLERAKAHGLLHGITVSLERRDSRSIASFSRSDREFSQSEVAQIESAVSDLHDATAATQPLAPEVREMLKRLSVAFTHPSARV